MVFSSIEFLFLFLPIFLLVQNFIPFRNITYAVASMFFYFVGEGWLLAVVLMSVFCNFFLGLAIEGCPTDRRRRIILALGVAINLASLFFFKYLGFFSTIAGVADNSWTRQVHLPLGISFFTFHSISYLVDIYRRDARPEHTIANLALYILMFPQLIAGPILRYHNIAPQLRDRKVDLDHVYNGMALFSYGLAQKVLIADTLAGVADPLFARVDSLSTSTAWLAAICYTFQIYFDFSGYSNMAIGLGWLTGFHFQPNFNFPYISQSITEFWRRWHISLSTWFKDYLYIPLGGNRKGSVRTYVNLVTVFFLCGLWHGAAWTFVVWGLYHGCLLVMERIGLGKLLARLPPPLAILYTFVAAVVGWVLFRSDSFAHARVMLSRMFKPWYSIEDMSALQILTGEELAALVAAILFSMPITLRVISKFITTPTEPGKKRWNFAGTVLGITSAGSIFMLATVKIISGAFSPFIYFRF